ncbi:prominin domain-containing protein [Ditylenchus destructor]|nr:prominin domain-containing protein [Ditylenchus destructor]
MARISFHWPCGWLHFLAVLTVFHIWPISSEESNPEPSKNASISSNVVQFQPYKRTESYKCGQFMENSINDPAMRLFHHFNNIFIRLLAQPFPHEKLLSQEALKGDLGEWKKSFQENHMQWIEFERNWLVICAVVVILPTVFTLFYLLYRCCVCCCSRGKKKRHTDKRFDSCQRAVLNSVLAVFVLVNVFCAVIMLINTQYAQYSFEELPTRMHYCTNDFSIYKMETNERIKKLLRDDFHTLNATLVHNFHNVGANVLVKIKKTTGLVMIDEIIDRTKQAGTIGKDITDLERDLRQFQASDSLFLKKITKLKESEESRLKILQPLLSDSASETSTGDMLPTNAIESLKQITDLNTEEKFAGVREKMLSLQSLIQDFVDQRQDDAIDRLKSLDDTMFRLYEDISSGIKGIDLRFLDDLVDPMMQRREQFRTYVQYSWIISLVVTGIFFFIALSFFLGLFYGYCGRRPSYHNDDCCVRSTGTKFYSCGIWMSLMFMAFFACITSVLIFVGANASSMVCLPMEDPLSHPDMLSLLDRLIDAYGLNGEAQEQSSRSSLDPDHHIPQIFTSTQRPVDIIKGCRRGATFYTMFGLDKKFKLLNDGGPRDEYEELSSLIKTFSSGRSFKLNDALNFYSSDLENALEQLGQIQVPSINESQTEQLRSLSSHFKLDNVLEQLTKISEKKLTNTPVHEAEVVIKYLESLKPEAQALASQLKAIVISLEKLKKDLDGMQFNATELRGQLQHTNSVLMADNLSDRLYTAANEVVLEDLVQNVERYANHVNRSMMTEISSCEPIKEIAKNTRAALCDYTIDPFNGVWMAMAISLLLMMPIIMITTSLMKLYDRIHPFPKYIVNEPATDAAFATDNYNGGYATGRANHSTPYTSSNYGYEYYPPPYLSTRG